MCIYRFSLFHLKKIINIYTCVCLNLKKIINTLVSVIMKLVKHAFRKQRNCVVSAKSFLIQFIKLESAYAKPIQSDPKCGLKQFGRDGILS